MEGRITIKSNPSERAGMVYNHTGEEQAVGNRFEIDLAALARLVLSKRRWIVGIVGPVMLLAVVIMLLTPNRYTSRATILPSGGKTNDLSALKAMVGGATNPLLTDGNSSMLFPLILKSRLIRDAVLSKRYNFTFESKPMNLSLPEYLGRDDPDKLRSGLAGITTINASNRTGEITIAVETEYPEFSQAIVQEYLSQLEVYNLHKRRSSAKDNERYLARQLEEAGQSLEEAEDKLEQFRMVNADWVATTSPEILTQLERLNRAVLVRSSAYLLLQQQYELAKLEAQKDVPIVRILDQASLPTQKSGPFRSITVIASGLVSFVVVVTFIIMLDLFRQARYGSNRESFELLSAEVSDAFPCATRFYEGIRRKFSRDAVSMQR